MDNYEGKHILLVEDERIIGVGTKINLGKMGYRVTLANNGAQAIEITNSDSSIDMILMDIDLGNGLNGIETCRIIFENKYIPIVFVSSHTEKRIVSLTEEITSYGYIVKSSHMTVYDASIKMAFKLYNEKKRREVFNRYLEVALNNSTDPVFITDTQGDIVFFNKAYLEIQGLNESQSCMVERQYEMYKTQITVFSENGKILEPGNWASSEALKGNASNERVYIVFHKGLNKYLANKYTYSPIIDDEKTIIGAYVKIEDTETEKYSDLFDQLRIDYHLPLA